MQLLPNGRFPDHGSSLGNEHFVTVSLEASRAEGRTGASLTSSTVSMTVFVDISKGTGNQEITRNLENGLSAVAGGTVDPWGA